MHHVDQLDMQGHWTCKIYDLRRETSRYEANNALSVVAFPGFDSWQQAKLINKQDILGMTEGDQALSFIQASYKADPVILASPFATLYIHPESSRQPSKLEVPQKQQSLRRTLSMRRSACSKWPLPPTVLGDPQGLDTLSSLVSELWKKVVAVKRSSSSGIPFAQAFQNLMQQLLVKLVMLINMNRR